MWNQAPVHTRFLVLVARAQARYGSLPNHEQLGVADPIADALAGIHGDYHQPVSVQALAEAAGLSANWFGEHFTAVTGLGVHEYVQRLRLEEARSLLEESEASLSAVAGRVGFDDPAYFSRIFKRHTGMSPRAYRTQARRAS